MLEVRIKGENLGLDGVSRRLRDFKPVLRRIAGSILQDPSKRERPDRWLGAAGRRGEIKTWAPGYEDHVQPVIRKRRLAEKSSRPFVPRLTEAAEAELTALTADFVLTEGEP